MITNQSKKPPLYYIILFAFLSLIIYSYYQTSHKSINVPISFQNDKSIPTTDVKKSSIFTSRTVGIGDLHGDLDHALKVLRMAKLIDSNSKWIGGETILVQTGDIVDRGKDTQQLYHLMDSLRPQAALAGGGLYSLLGNHEIMNALNDLRYVTASDINTFKGGLKERQETMKTGWIGETWRKNYAITARVPFSHKFPELPSSLRFNSTNPSKQNNEDVNETQLFFNDLSSSPSSKGVDNPFIQAAASFVHGGITSKYISTLSSSQSPVTSINAIGSQILHNILNTPGTIHGLPPSTTPEQKYFYGAEGPVWDRTFALEEDEELVCQLAEESCKLLGVRHLIMGHTPNFDGIVSRCNGKILLIDTGISRAYGGALSSLEILYTLIPRAELNQKEALTLTLELKDSKKNVWLEREIVSALYEDRKEVLHRSETFLILPQK